MVRYDRPDTHADAIRPHDSTEIMFRSTFENAAVGMAHVAPDGRWLRINQRVCDILGYDQDELLKKTFQEITHPDDLDLDLNFLNDVIAGRRESYAIEKRYFHSTGKIVWVNLTVGCVRDEAGGVAYFISVLEDITEKKNLRQALDESEARFRSYQQSSPDGFIIFQTVRRKDGRIEDFALDFMNPAAEAMMGRRMEDCVGERMLEVMPSNRELGLFDAYCRVVETGETWQGEVRYPRSFGAIWLRISATRVAGGFAVSFQDITSVKTSDIMLRENENRLRSILNNVMALVGLITPEGTLLEVNELVLRSAGAVRADLIGRPFWDCPWWKDQPETRQKVRNAVLRAGGGERSRFDVDVRMADGAVRTIDFQFAPICNEAGEVVEIIPSGVDISERKAAEAHREMLVHELSHRVKNSLATVQAIASHTMREETNLEAFRESFSGRLRAIAACHDLLIATTRSAADISQLVRDQVSPYAKLDSRRVCLSGPPLVLGPEPAYAFGLILHELATNAVKYGAWSNQTGRVDVIWNAATDERGNACIEVDWREQDGPAVSVPARKGFGSILIEQSLSHSLGGKAEICYAPEGLRAKFRFPRKERK